MRRINDQRGRSHGSLRISTTGDVVNTASRQGFNKYRDPNRRQREVIRGLDGLLTRELGAFRLKGKKNRWGSMGGQSAGAGRDDARPARSSRKGWRHSGTVPGTRHEPRFNGASTSWEKTVPHSFISDSATNTSRRLPQKNPGTRW
jgi:hypothetical protein